MTVNTDTATASYTGNGSTALFSVPFYFLVDTDLKVSKLTAAGVSSVLVLNSDYTVTGAGVVAGGSITTTPALPTDDKIYIERNVDAVQQTAYPVNGAFPATSHERALDRLTMLVQQLLAKLTFGLFRNPLTASYDAGGNTISNAANAVNPQDVPTLVQMQDAVASGAPFLGIARTDLSNAVASQISTWLNNDVVVPTRDYGLDHTGVSANDAAMAVLLASVQLNVDGRGRRIRFLSGKYRFDSTIAFTQYAAGLVQNIILEGDGAANTVFDFGSAPAGSDGITLDSGTHVTIRDIAVNYAPRDGIVLGAGLSPGGSAYLSMVTIERVRVQGAGRHALNMTNTYLCSVRDSWFKDMAGNGINVAGFSTSLQFDRCECSGSTGGIGYALNGVIYATLNSCGSDSNNQQGYAFSNCQGVVLNGCGAEANGKDSYLLTTSTASTTGIPSVAQDIRGMVFNGCYGLSGSQLTPGNYATFIGANTQDSRSIEFKINGGAAHGATASDRALILAGVSGQVTCHKDLFDDSGCVAADSLTGTTEVSNATVRGRTALAIPSTSQTFTTAVQTTLTLASLSKNTLGAALSANAIVIPRGVSRVRVTASVSWAASSVGSRYMEVQKNGAGFSGMPILRVPGVGSIQPVSLHSGVIDVVAGDTILLSLAQDSGGNLAVNAPANSTFLQVEAVG